MEQLKQFTRSMGRWLMTLLLVMSTSLAARAIEAYAYFTGHTLTFYYDNLRSTRHNGETFSLNTGPQPPGWISYYVKPSHHHRHQLPEH